MGDTGVGAVAVEALDVSFMAVGFDVDLMADIVQLFDAAVMVAFVADFRTGAFAFATLLLLRLRALLLDWLEPESPASIVSPISTVDAGRDAVILDVIDFEPNKYTGEPVSALWPMTAADGIRDCFLIASSVGDEPFLDVMEVGSVAVSVSDAEGCATNAETAGVFETGLKLMKSLVLEVAFTGCTTSRDGSVT